MNILKYLLTLTFVCFTCAAPQQPEINDQFIHETTELPIKVEPPGENTGLPKNEAAPTTSAQPYTPEFIVESFTTRIYRTCTIPIIKLLSTPKVLSVLRNIGICIVNGAMELITYYLPAPLIPLIASAAGMVIPFEPVVLLKEKMPVTSYRRAFRTAMDSFMGTFDQFKMDDTDPYMTRRFNRRLNYDSHEKQKNDIQDLLDKKIN